jgi:superfamily I DNA and RNA helicase
MESLALEFEKVKAEQFKLHFRYPTEEERKTMTTVNRDMSKAEQERSAKRRNNFAEIIASLESGESILEDYPDALIEKLQALLARKPRRARK